MPTTANVVFAAPTTGVDLCLRPDHNLVTGVTHFQRAFSNTTSLEEDLLTVSAAVFACDLAVKRGDREEFARRIDLSIPVVNLSAFNSVRDALRYALYVVSNDVWNISFTQKGGTPETPREWFEGNSGKVLLFSGGLDSLAAAVQYASAGEAVQLVSHVTANRSVIDAQTGLFDYLQATYPRKCVRLPIRVGARTHRQYAFPTDGEREETQRTRSLVFLTLGVLTARRRGFREVVVIAENGQMAIHLPLTAARISAFSTHTAHPEFVAAMEDVFRRLLNFQVHIRNPFLYLTKGEVVDELVRSHFAIVPRAISCWKASRVPGTKTHCGFCIPCLVRRLAVETHGQTIDEFQRDIFMENVGSLRPDDDGKRNLMELGEFVCNFNLTARDAQLQRLYPELINPPIDTVQAIAMYRRFAAEARNVFARYPQVAALVQ